MSNSNVKIKCPHCGKEITMTDAVKNKIYQSENLQTKMREIAEQIDCVEHEITYVECQIKTVNEQKTNAKHSSDLKCLQETLQVLHCKLDCLKSEKEKLNNDLVEIKNKKCNIQL